jgi:hypothetical protein
MGVLVPQSCVTKATVEYRNTVQFTVLSFIPLGGSHASLEGQTHLLTRHLLLIQYVMHVALTRPPVCLVISILVVPLNYFRYAHDASSLSV